MRFAAVMAVASTIISWGPWMELAGVDHTSIPLPAAILDHLPLADNFVFARFALYADLFVAILLAIGLDEWRQVQLTRTREPTRRRRLDISWWRTSVLASALVITFIPLIPAWPITNVPVDKPAFFTTSAVRRIEAGSVVLTYPYASSTRPNGMLWQALADMRFKLIGGYALTRAATGGSTYSALPPTDQEVAATLIADATGKSLTTILPGAKAATPEQLRRFLYHYDVGAVIFQSVGSHPARAFSLIESAIGSPVARGGVYVWYSVQHRLSS